MFSVAGFRSVLTETATWCKGGRGPSPSKDFQRPRVSLLDLCWKDKQQAVQASIEWRAKALAATDERPSSDPNRSDGRVLAVVLGWVIYEGLMETETRSFFDAKEVPPCDTWLGLLRATHSAGTLAELVDAEKDIRERTFELLLAWVPERFIEATQRGMDLNALGSMFWAAEYSQAGKWSETLAELTHEGLVW